MRRHSLPLVVLGLLLVPLLAAATATTADVARRVQGGTMVKYIPSRSIDLGVAVPGLRDYAGGLALDASGNLYVAVTNQSYAVEIAVLSPDGRLIRRWDPTGGASVGDPTLLAIGPDGLVYVRNRNERIVRVFTPGGAPVRTFGGALSANNNGDLELDSAGNVYTVDLGRIVKFNPAGTVSSELSPLPGIQADRVHGLAIAPDGSLYITVDPRGTGLAEEPPFLVHADSSGRRLADPAPLLHQLLGFNAPHGYEPHDIDFANGRLYIAGEGTGGNGAVAVLTPNGNLVDVVTGGRGRQVGIRGEHVVISGLETRTAARSAAETRSPIGQLDGVPVYDPGHGGDVSGCGGTGHTIAREGNRIPDIVFKQKPSGCLVTVVNIGTPCPKTAIPVPVEVLLGGQEITGAVNLKYFAKEDMLFFELPANLVGSGNLIVKWTCTDKQTNVIDVRYEWKARIDVLTDPSGNVLDAKSGRPIAGATVRLQYSPTRVGSFGSPSANAYSPQVHPQTTGRDGFFGWDVADGFWRLRVTAFGYRSFTSKAYEVPPAVTGLRLRLKPDPRQQRFLLDPRAGRAGVVKVGARARGKRIPGLRLKVVRGRVRSITVRSKRFRTLSGIRLGAAGRDLLRSYPAKEATARRVLTSTKRFAYRVGKGTFTVRRGRIIGIRLGP